MSTYINITKRHQQKWRSERDGIPTSVPAAAVKGTVRPLSSSSTPALMWRRIEEETEAGDRMQFSSSKERLLENSSGEIGSTPPGLCWSWLFPFVAGGVRFLVCRFVCVCCWDREKWQTSCEILLIIRNLDPARYRQGRFCFRLEANEWADRSCLVRFFWDHPVPLQAVRGTLDDVWKCRGELNIFEAGFGLYQFLFPSVPKRNWVLKTQPWSFQLSIMNMIRFVTPSENLFNQLQFMDIAVKLAGIPIDCRTLAFGHQMLEKIGEVKKINLFIADSAEGFFIKGS
ncbi:hypothetical protein LINPERHAP2_LOCUS38813 [Linum perenne]